MSKFIPTILGVILGFMGIAFAVNMVVDFADSIGSGRPMSISRVFRETFGGGGGGTSPGFVGTIPRGRGNNTYQTEEAYCRSTGGTVTINPSTGNPSCWRPK